MLLNYGVGEDSWVPWTARRLNQSILKEINPEYLLEGLMLKLQYFCHPKRRAYSLEKTLMLGKEEKGMTKDEMVWWHHQFNGHEFAQTPGNSEWQGSLVCCISWGRKELDITEWLKNNNRTLQVNYTSIERTKKYDLPKMSYKYCY